MKGNHKAAVYAADFGANNFEKNIVSGGQDAELNFWDFTKGQVEHTLTFYHKPAVKKEKKSKHIVWVSDVSWEKETGETIAVAFVDGTVAVYGVNWGKSLTLVAKPGFKNKRHYGVVNAVTFLHNRRNKIISCGIDGTIILHDIMKPGEEEVMFAHGSNVTSVATHRNEPNVLISCSSDKTCKVWDIRNLKQKNSISDLNSSANTVCFSPAGNSFAVGCDDGTCRLYDWRFSGSGEISCYYDNENRPQPIDNLCFAAQGGLLIATYGNTISVCNAVTSELDSSFEFSLIEDKNQGYITSLNSHDTLKRFATTSVDKTVKVWKVAPIKRE